MAAMAVGWGCAAGGASAAAPARPAPASVTLQWVGDIALSTQRGLPPGGMRRALAPVAGTLRAADVTTGKPRGDALDERPVEVRRDRRPGTALPSRPLPRTAFGLAALGFDVVNQANNHSMDYGATGRAQTLAALRRARVAETGLPGQITYRRVHGVRVAFLGFAPYGFDANLLDIGAAQRMVTRARRHASLVVVFIHAGAEGADRAHTPYGSEFFVGENRGRRPRLRPRGDPGRRRARARVRAARDPWRRALPRAADRLLAGQLRRLPHARRRGRASISAASCA